MTKKYNIDLNSSILDLTAVGQVSRETALKVVQKLEEDDDITVESFYNMLSDESREECTEKSSMVLDCSFTSNDEYYQIDYDLDENDEEQVHHLLRFNIADNSAVRASTGAVSSTMPFDRNQPFTLAEFSILGMKMTLEIVTRQCDWKFDENGGRAKLEYVISQNSQYLQLCSISLKVTSYMQKGLFEDESD